MTLSVFLLIKGTPDIAEASARAYGVPILRIDRYSEKYDSTYARTTSKFEDATRDWFVTHVKVPYPQGALLWFRVLDS